MARVSKAVSYQSAVMRTTPPNDPPVMCRRSEAGDWGKKCLRIGRQFGNSSGDCDIAHCLFRSVATILGIAEGRDGSCIRIDEPVLGNSVLSIEIPFTSPDLRQSRNEATPLRSDFQASGIDAKS